MKRNLRFGFTLVELLVVIAVLFSALLLAADDPPAMEVVPLVDFSTVFFFRR
jgi:prepilin-type N-terminal cleavage/methylation domain-containing protein